MLNVRFALQSTSDAVPDGWRDVKHELATRLIENTRVLPRAFIPRNVRLGLAPDKEIEEMSATDDFSERAWLQVNEHVHDRFNGGGIISAFTRPNGLLIDVTKDGAGFVVISESSWRGWRAYVDDKRVDVIRANYAFLAVFVPGGRHMIRLEFMPQSFVTGRTISVIAIVIALVALVLVAVRR